MVMNFDRPPINVNVVEQQTSPAHERGFFRGARQYILMKRRETISLARWLSEVDWRARIGDGQMRVDNRRDQWVQRC
jgi:hypothetical protein